MTVWKLGLALLATVAPAWTQCTGASALFISEEPINIGTVTQGVPFQFPVQILFTNQTGSLTALVDVVGPLTDVTFDPDLASKIGRQATVDFVVTATATAADEQTAQIGALAGVSAGTSNTATAADEQTFGQIIVNVACGGVPAANPGRINLVVDVVPGISGPSTFYENPQTGHRSEPVSTATGELFGHDEFADLTIPGPLGLELRRYYASYLAGNGVESALGRNWMHNFDMKLAVSGNEATVTLFRGKTVRFTRSGDAWQLAGAERFPYQLVSSGADNRFLNVPANRIYTFNSNGALIRIEDRSGNALTITQSANSPTMVADGLGRTLTLTYTGTNLTGVQDNPGRGVMFEQTGGNLSSFTDANGKRFTYAYTNAGGLNGLLTAETRPIGNVPLRQEYDAEGRVARQLDSNGNALSLAYSAANRGATVTEPQNVTLSQAHDDQRNLISQSDPSGATITFEYDANGRPTEITDRTGAVTQATWDPASGLPASYRDPLGNTTRYTYATTAQGGFTFHDLSRIDLPDGTAISLERDASGRVTAVTDQAGQRWQATWNDRGQVMTLTNPSGGTTTYTYANNGTVASARTHAVDTTTLRYDAASRLDLLTHPDNVTVGFEYDARNNLLRHTNERSDAQSAAFNDNNLVRTVTDRAGETTTFAYNTDDRVSTVTDPLGNVTQQTYDELQRVQSVVNPEGDRVTYAYDAFNRPTSVVDATGKGLTFQWDQESRLTSVTDALNRTTQLTRDALGRVTSVRTPDNATYSYEYDVMSRLTRATNPLEQAAQYGYDARGLLSEIALPENIKATIERDERGDVRVVTDPNGSNWTQSWDASGRLVSKTDPLGRTIGYEYDSRRRVSRLNFPEGNVQFSYDAAGNLTRQTYSDGTVLDYAYDRDHRLVTGSGLALGYDAAGRMTTSNGLQIGRDRNGRIASVTYADGKVVRYSYNNRGLLERVEDWVGGSTQFMYNDARELVAITFPNGVREDYTYDANGRPASIRYSRGGEDIASVTLTRDAAGRVISAQRSAAAIPDPPGGILSLAYDAAHQPSRSTHDTLGRVTRGLLNTYTWDLASRLTSYSGPKWAGILHLRRPWTADLANCGGKHPELCSKLRAAAAFPGRGPER